MVKTVACRDTVGFDCDGVVKGETEEATLSAVAQHARRRCTGFEVTPDVAAKVKSVMRDGPAPA